MMDMVVLDVLIAGFVVYQRGMRRESWKNYYHLIKLNFFILMISPCLILPLLILFYINGVLDILLLLIGTLVIIMAIVGGLLIKFSMGYYRNSFMKLYMSLSTDKVYSCVQETLTDNKIIFSVLRNIRRKKSPPIHYDICFESPGEGLEIGIIKPFFDKNNIFILLAYSNVTRSELIQNIKNEIDRRLNSVSRLEVVS